MILPGADGSFMLGDGKRRGGNQADQITMPLTMNLHGFATYSGGQPVYSQKPRVELSIDGRSARVFHEGTGPGGIALGPPELLDYHQYGSAVFAGGRWPTTISPTTLLLLNSSRVDASTGDNARTYLAWGRLLQGTHKPGYGMYASFNPSTRVLDFRVTDAAGDDENAGGISLNGSPIGMPNLIQVTPQYLLMSGDVDDFLVTSSLLLCDPSTTIRRLTGMVEAEGALVKIENVSTDGTAMVLAHLADSDMPNQFFSPTGADVTLAPGQGCWAAYDDVNNYWVLNGVPGGGGGGADDMLPEGAIVGTGAADLRAVSQAVCVLSGDATLTGITEPDDTALVVEKVILNTSAYNYTINDWSDTVSNVLTGVGGPLTLGPGQACLLRWSPAVELYVIVGN